MSKELGLPGKPLRGALVGFGNVAIRAHLPIWRDNPDFRIEAVIEPHPDRARLVADYLPEIPVYPGLEALQGKSSIDFVDICTPPGMHAETILGACRGGLHVFCEKPLVTAWEDFERVCLACRASGTVVFSVNNWKYAPLWEPYPDPCSRGTPRENPNGFSRGAAHDLIRRRRIRLAKPARRSPAAASFSITVGTICI